MNLGITSQRPPLPLPGAAATAEQRAEIRRLIALSNAVRVATPALGKKR